MIAPSSGNVALKRLEPESITKGGIVIPESSQQQQEQAEVMFISEGKTLESGKHIPPIVSVGDIVLIKKNTGVETKLNNEELVIIKEDDILAILEQ